MEPCEQVKQTHLLAKAHLNHCVQLGKKCEEQQIEIKRLRSELTRCQGEFAAIGRSIQHRLIEDQCPPTYEAIAMCAERNARLVETTLRDK